MSADAEENHPAMIRFAEVAAVRQANFKHVSPPTHQRHLHLTMGAGVGWLDYDADGWPDLYCCQGVPFKGTFAAAASAPADVLLRNFAGAFVDVGQLAGIGNTAYAMGIAAGDFDNDGFMDLYVSNVGRNCLYRNNGDGTFGEIASGRQLDNEHFGTSCSWADIDNDGDLDLWVSNYLRIDPAKYPTCPQRYEGTEIYVTCHPRFQPAEHDFLFRNDGNGQFSDISESGGLRIAEPHQGLGVIASDLDDDGDVDFYVANDTVPNQLWENDGTGHFLDQGLVSGCALNRRGVREAGMGLAAGDVDGNGTFDLVVTNYFNETNTLYRNEGQLFFLDVTDEMGLASPSLTRLGFGTSLCDFDNDGWLDLFVANGHVNDQLNLMGRKGEPFAQLPQLLHNRQGLRFEEVSPSSGTYFQQANVGRSTADADFNRDGKSDLAVQHLNRPLGLLLNESEQSGDSLQIELIGTQAARHAIAATVVVEVGTRRISRYQQGSCSYLGCSEKVLTIGLGAAPHWDRITVKWPSGRREFWIHSGQKGIVRLIEGKGRPEE